MSKQNPEGVPANLSETARQAQASGGATQMISREDAEGEAPQVTSTLPPEVKAVRDQDAVNAESAANDERIAKLREKEEREQRDREQADGA